MAITRYPPRTILLGGHDGGHAVIVNDLAAGEAILPGQLVQRYQRSAGVSAFRKNNTAAALQQRAVALNAVMLERSAVAQAWFGALVRAQQALGELEDAVERPLEPGDIPQLTPQSPALKSPAKEAKQ